MSDLSFKLIIKVNKDEFVQKIVKHTKSVCSIVKGFMVSGYIICVWRSRVVCGCGKCIIDVLPGPPVAKLYLFLISSQFHNVKKCAMCHFRIFIGPASME